MLEHQIRNERIRVKVDVDELSQLAPMAAGITAANTNIR